MWPAQAGQLGLNGRLGARDGRSGQLFQQAAGTPEVQRALGPLSGHHLIQADTESLQHMVFRVLFPCTVWPVRVGLKESGSSNEDGLVSVYPQKKQYSTTILFLLGWCGIHLYM